MSGSLEGISAPGAAAEQIGGLASVVLARSRRALAAGLVTAVTRPTRFGYERTLN